MAKLTIRPRPEYRDQDGVLPPHAYEVLLDGRPVPNLRGVEVYLDAEEVPQARIAIYVDELDVDANTLVELAATLIKQRQAEGEGGKE